MRSLNKVVPVLLAGSLLASQSYADVVSREEGEVRGAAPVDTALFEREVQRMADTEAEAQRVAREKAAAEKQEQERVARERAEQAAKDEARANALKYAETKYGAALSCPSKLIESQLGGTEGVMAGARYLQQVLDARDMPEELRSIQRNCEKLRASFQKSKMVPRYLLPKQLDGLRVGIRTLKDDVKIQKVVDYALAHPHTACSFKTASIRVPAFVLGPILGGAKAVCETPLGLRYSFAGPMVGVSMLGIGASVGGETGVFNIPKWDLWKKRTLGRGLNFRAGSVGRGQVFAEDAKDENIQGKEYGLGFGWYTEGMGLVRLGETSPNMAYYLDSGFLSGVQEFTQHELAK